MIIMKPYEHIIVVEVGFGMKCCTIHSLHMNHLGKEKIVLKIASVIREILLKQEEIISL